MATQSIDKLCEQRQLSAAELARRSGLRIERVQAILCGRWLPSPRERISIAAALEVAVDQVSWGHSMSPRNVRYHRFGLKEDFS